MLIGRKTKKKKLKLTGLALRKSVEQKYIYLYSGNPYTHYSYTDTAAAVAGRLADRRRRWSGNPARIGPQ